MAKHRRDLFEGRRWSEAEAREILKEARRSGVSLWAYATEHGLVPERLYRWARKLEANGTPSELPSFAEVAVASGRSDVEIELRSGRVVRVSSDVDPGALRRLLEVIEGDGAC